MTKHFTEFLAFSIWVGRPGCFVPMKERWVEACLDSIRVLEVDILALVEDTQLAGEESLVVGSQVVAVEDNTGAVVATGLDLDRTSVEVVLVQAAEL
jgi:hypothetical protein